jgi:ribosomal protein L25 (general stress protein Ctc)
MISFCYTKKSSGNVSITTNEHRFQNILKTTITNSLVSLLHYSRTLYKVIRTHNIKTHIWHTAEHAS